MWKDPIVEEIHAIREQIARDFDYDMKRIMDHLRAEEAKHPGRLIGKAELRAARAAISSPDADRKDAA
jgi:hypothetical protein